MEMIHEDDWEMDIHFSDTQVFQRKGVYSVEPDKELSLACERYQYQYEYLEDSESETNSTVLSTYSAITDKSTMIRGLDDFMYAEQPGTVQRLSGSGRVLDYDDWNDELDFTPQKLKQQKARTYDSHLDLVDSPTNQNLYSTSNVYLCEPETENDELGGLDFPQDLTLLPKKLSEKKRGTVIQSTLQQQEPRKLALIQREKEDDDFCEGLNIKTFQIGKKVPTTKPQPQSRIPLLKPLRLQQIPSPRLHRFTMATAASKRREAETRAHSTKLKPKKPDSTVVERRGANGTTLIARPKKNKDYGYSSQLDELDNLSTFKAKKKFTLA
ncbi:hypothetical protein G6F56_006568 [Rhizopus delemar]|nr:hypothetical protein G6F56_006568 [Rhizopus delemar]